MTPQAAKSSLSSPLASSHQFSFLHQYLGPSESVKIDIQLVNWFTYCSALPHALEIMAYNKLMQDADDTEDVGLLEEPMATSPPGTLWQRAKPSVVMTALMCATALITFIITHQHYRSNLDTAAYAPWQGKSVLSL